MPIYYRSTVTPSAFQDMLGAMLNKPIDVLVLLIFHRKLPSTSHGQLNVTSWHPDTSSFVQPLDLRLSLPA